MYLPHPHRLSVDGSIRPSCRAVFCVQVLQSIPRGVGPTFLLRSYDEYEEWILTTENYALPGAFICEYKA